MPAAMISLQVCRFESMGPLLIDALQTFGDSNAEKPQVRCLVESCFGGSFCRAFGGDKYRDVLNVGVKSHATNPGGASSPPQQNHLRRHHSLGRVIDHVGAKQQAFSAPPADSIDVCVGIKGTDSDNGEATLSWSLAEPE